MVRDTVHVTALETAVLQQFNDGRPCKTKTRKPPSPTALAHAQALRDARAGVDDRDVVIDIQTYAAAAADRQVAACRRKVCHARDSGSSRQLAPLGKSSSLLEFSGNLITRA